MIDINDWQHFDFNTLIEFVKVYDQRPESIDKITRAYNLAKSSHVKPDGKPVLRDSGDEYITHPVMVANFLAIMRVDIDTICAGLLHDVVEDTPVTLEKIEKEFGVDVANIVDGVTKFDDFAQVNFEKYKMSIKEKNKAALKQLTHMKIFDNLTFEVRVIIVKLIDRLSNMLTIEYKTPVKQKSKALETLSIYVPLANKFGMYRIQQLLEDASLKCIYPMLYERIRMNREMMKIENLPMIDDMFENMKKIIKDNIKLVGHYDSSEMNNRSTEELFNETLLVGKNLSRTRIKHIYGIYDALLKLKPSNVSEETYLKTLLFSKETFEKIHDLRVVKLIMKDEISCWMARMLLHKTYSPVDKYGHDYIANPKANMYQSLHDTVLINGKFVQFQIRTEEQEFRDTYGIAWELYKFEGENTRERILEEFKKYPTYKKMLEIKEDKTITDLGNYQSLVEKEILNTKEITVINKTTGKNITIRDDATIHDFAFQIGGELGNHLVKATLNDVVYELRYNKNGKIDNDYNPFNVRLRNGDEISVEFDENVICPRQSTNIDRKKVKKFTLFKRREVK